MDATTPNTGTMPSNSPSSSMGTQTATGDATGAATARDATDVHGTSNPDIESSITANADTNAQRWGHRRFVSHPLAAHTFAIADGNWTWSFACSESNLNHNMTPFITIYAWRPSSGAYVGSFAAGDACQMSGVEPTSAGTEQAQSTTATGFASTSILDGDILVFDVYSAFTQGMSTAYTDQFAYNGTTEASTTTCASFVTPPAALTLFSGLPFDTQQGSLRDDPFSIQAILQAVNRAATY